MKQPFWFGVVSNQKEIPYDELGKHFKEPINKDVKRIPRKLKKKWNFILQSDYLKRFPLDVKLWYILEYTNPNYKRFLIKNIIENEK